MKAVIQRVSSASVVIENETVSKINSGLLILLGCHLDDNKDDVLWLTKKIVQLRIFSDTNGQMNLDVNEVNGDILVVSQFTLYANTKKGNRPSFIQAANPILAIPLYEFFIQEMKRSFGKEVFTGRFGADMKVHLINDGPVTIIIDTKNKQ